MTLKSSRDGVPPSTSQWQAGAGSGQFLQVHCGFFAQLAIHNDHFWNLFFDSTASAKRRAFFQVERPGRLAPSKPFHPDVPSPNFARVGLVAHLARLDPSLSSFDDVDSDKSNDAERALSWRRR